MEPWLKRFNYKTYIKLMVEYASTIWDPHIRRNINKLEQVQRHSAHYVTGNHDYTSSISLQCCVILNGQHWSSIIISAA